MSKPAGIVLILTGGVVTLGGIAVVLRPLVKYYQETANAPLEEPSGEGTLRQDMLKGIGLGAAGVPLLIAGRMMVHREAVRRRRRR